MSVDVKILSLSVLSLGVAALYGFLVANPSSKFRSLGFLLIFASAYLQHLYGNARVDRNGGS